MRRDAIVNEVRHVRNELVKCYGGLDGWIEHLQTMDRERARRVKRHGIKKPASAGRKRPGKLSMPRHGE